MLLIFGCLLNGAVLSKYGLYMPWYLVGGILMTIGAALMCTVDFNTSTSAIYGYTVLIGLGSGIFAITAFSVAQAVVDPKDIPAAIGFAMCGQVTGIAISVSIANSVFLNEAQAGIAAILPGLTKDEIQRSVAGHGSAFVQSLSPELRLGVLKAIVEGLSKTYILVAVAGGIVTLGSLALKRERLFVTLAVGA